MNNEIDWLCHLGVVRGIYDADQLRSLWNISTDQTTLMEFSQSTLDNGFTHDMAGLQSLMEDACSSAVLYGACPDSILVEQSIDISSAPTSTAETQASHAPGEVPFSMDGFPDLSQAETCSTEEARELVKQFLTYARSIGASDVHISALSQPHIRRFSINFLIDNQAILTKEAAEKLNMAMLSARQVKKFQETMELDYSLDLGNNQRYRSNVMRHFRGTESSFRIISDKIKNLRELGFRNAEVIEKLTTYHQGLILVTGPAGAGKTTTLAALVDLINGSRKDHIICVEDPVEIIIPSRGCTVTQRELYSSTKSFPNALRAALREDPDIIIIGEMRDLETIEMAISAAETGQLGVGTLHTSSAAATLDRLLDVFPPSQQSQIRAMLAESLKGIICQVLIPDKHGKNLLMAPEVLICTLAVSNLIKENKTYQLPSVIETGSKKGMISSEDSVIQLFMEELITADQAKPYINSTAKMLKLEEIERAGGAQAYQQQMISEQEMEQQKKGWFK